MLTSIARLMLCTVPALAATACHRAPPAPDRSAVALRQDQLCAARYVGRDGRADARAAAGRGDYKMLYFFSGGEVANLQVAGSACLVGGHHPDAFFQAGAPETFGCDVCSPDQELPQCGDIASAYMASFNLEMLRRAPRLSVAKLNTLPNCRVQLRDVTYLDSIGRLDRIPDTASLAAIRRGDR